MNRARHIPLLVAATLTGSCDRPPPPASPAPAAPSTSALPPDTPPPPPLLPGRAQLLGEWVLVSIDDAAPPPGAPPIALTFADGRVHAKSQCIAYDWLIGVEDGRLKLRPPPGPVAMCARATSPWEDRFGAAMSAAAYIESHQGEIIVTGPRGRLRLKRPR